MKGVLVGDRLIGPGAPCFIAAEVGLNHNGDLDLAHRLIDAAADAGADGVKFQNYRTDDFISDRSIIYEYVSSGQTIVESQYDMFLRYELPRSWLPELKEHCDERGLVFFSTPTSQDGIADLVEIGVLMLKNGSDFLGHLPLIEAMAQTGLPTVLSTGMATLADVDEAVRAFRRAGGEQLVLLHCTSAYPTPFSDVHLRKIPVLAQALGCPVGFSDHTVGSVAAVGAVALGACFIEKHFTLDKGLPGPDHRFSADPDEFKGLVDAVRAVEAALGESRYQPAASELESRREYRLSCVAAHDLPAGHLITRDDVVFRRPGTGVPPQGLDWIVGRRLVRGVNRGKVFAAEDFR